MASTLRRRIFGGDSHAESRESTPKKVEEVQLAPVSKIMTDKNKPKSRKRRSGLIFFLGGLFGIVAAGFFAQKNDLIDLPEFGDLSMDSVFDVLPAGLIKDAKDLSVRHRAAQSRGTC